MTVTTPTLLPNPPKRHRWVPWIAGLTGLVVGVAVGTGGGTDPAATADTTPVPTVTVPGPTRDECLR